MPTIIHLINKYCTTHSYPIYTYYLTSYNDQGEDISMTFTNSTDLFQRKLINYEIKNVTLDTSLSVWESDKERLCVGNTEFLLTFSGRNIFALLAIALLSKTVAHSLRKQKASTHC